MNKTDLVNILAEEGNISKQAAGRAFTAMLDALQGAVKNGDKVAIAGFGTFSLVERAARTGTNPKSGAKVQIAASRAPKFKPGKAFKDAVQ